MILETLNYWATNIPIELVCLDALCLVMLLMGLQALKILIEREYIFMANTLLIVLTVWVFVIVYINITTVSELFVEHYYQIHE
jgi:hypothetical protein